jgi:hypothetical protein
MATATPTRVSCSSMSAKRTAVLTGAAVLASWGVSVGIASADPPAPPPGPKTTIDHDGTYSVGKDIAAGTYSSAGPVGGGTCYWKRLGGANGNEVVDNAISKKPQVVQLDPSDKAFKTDGCQPWQMTDPANAPDDLPPMAAEAQLHGYLNDLNLRSLLSGGGQVPQP